MEFAALKTCFSFPLKKVRVTMSMLRFLLNWERLIQKWHFEIWQKCSYSCEIPLTKNMFLFPFQTNKVNKNKRNLYHFIWKLNEKSCNNIIVCNTVFIPPSFCLFWQLGVDSQKSPILNFLVHFQLHIALGYSIFLVQEGWSKFPNS